ncbi:MAG: hypothetical protein CMJ31_13015, partial [Phycisphaerae bacterium]|nr:hypothetical protein [Phycisphaerae bacterium]
MDHSPTIDTVTTNAPHSPLPLSVAIACRNNQDTIGRTLDSVRGLATEIIAVDSGSRDGTVRMLKDAGATVIKSRWLGYVQTKQKAVDGCTQPWVLLLDSDESLSDELATSIRRLIERDDPATIGAKVNRRVWYRGEPLRHAFQPEWRLRLARRERMTIAGYDPHDRVDVEARSGERVAELVGDLRHDSFPTFAAHLARQARHARDAAKSLHGMGRRSSIPQLIAAGPVEFLKQAVGKSAWRDGTAGWLAASSMAAYATMKHACLLERELIGAGADNDDSDQTGRRADGAAANNARSAGGVERAQTARAGNNENVTDETNTATMTDTSENNGESTPEIGVNQTSMDGDDAPKKKRRRRRRRGKGGEDTSPNVDDQQNEGDDADDADDRSRRAKRKTGLTPVKAISDEAKEHVFDTAKGFADLGLKPELLEVLNDAGWAHPTKIQAELIPVAVTGKDVLGQAKTGSGKTAAFGLPLLQMCEQGIPFQALVLAPTRELALQIRDDMEALGERTGLNICPVYGGQKIETQARRLEKRPEIIVGTPGRVMDMNQRGYLRLDQVKFAVLDEVDRMFDIGFRDDIKRILSMCGKPRQTIFVSATISDEIERLVRKEMNEPVRLDVAAGSLTVEMVKQFHIPVAAWDKRRMLTHVLTHEEPDLTIVFCRMKRTVDDVVRYLGDKGIEAHALHGDMSQGKRNQTMKNFRHGELNVLVASDLAARG